MKNFLTKNVTNSVLDVDDKSRRVKIVIAKTGNLDRDKEIIDPGAFNKSIKERGPKGSNEIWHLIDHTPSLARALGKFSELYVEGDNLIAINEKVIENNLGNDIIKLYRDGHINQHSIGFSIPTGKTETKDGITHIREVMLWEGSAVLWGANPETPTLSVGKSEETIHQRFDKCIAMLKKGDYSDDLLKLMAIELTMMQSEIEKGNTPKLDDLLAIVLSKHLPLS